MIRLLHLIISIGFVQGLYALDWPQFMGPGRDGVSAETALNVDWTKKEPAVLWKTNVQTGVASSIIVQGRLYTMGNQDEVDSLRCLDALTGKPLWTQTYRCKFTTRSYDGGAAATPTYDEGRLYTMSTTGQVGCWSAEDGKKLWKVNLLEDYAGEKIKWGRAESPLVVDGAVYVQAGGAGCSLVALDKRTGARLWQHGDDKAAYASGRVYDHGGTKAVAFFNEFGLVGSNAATSETLFRYEWKTDFGVNASLPLWQGGAFFLSSGYGGGCAVVEVMNGAPVEKWRNKELFLHFQNSVLIGAHLYAVSGDNRGNTKGQLKCVEFSTGKVCWSEPMGQTYGQCIVVAGKLLILTDQGEVVMIDPNPEKYVELNRQQVLGGARSWSVPAFANGLLYVRQNLGELVCLDLRP